MDAKTLAAEQAEDDGLWFHPETAPEAYLQQAIRRLHAAIEQECICHQDKDGCPIHTKEDPCETS